MKTRDLLKWCISIDLETTHLDPSKGSVIAAGACLFNKPDELYLECYLRRGAEIDPRSLLINGENERGLKLRTAVNYCSELELYNQIANFAVHHDAKVIIGKNPEFDYNWLKFIHDHNKGGANPFPFSYRKVNWSNLVIPLMLREEIEIDHTMLSGDAISRFVGLKEEPKPHNALNGAKHNRECALKILEMYRIS